MGIEIYTREAQLEIFTEKRMEMDEFLVYEMKRAIDTEGETDIARLARDAQRALYTLDQAMRFHYNE